MYRMIMNDMYHRKCYAQAMAVSTFYDTVVCEVVMVLYALDFGYSNYHTNSV